MEIIDIAQTIDGPMHAKLALYIWFLWLARMSLNVSFMKKWKGILKLQAGQLFIRPTLFLAAEDYT